MVSKLFVCLNDEPAEDDDKLVKVWECAWVQGEIKSVLGY